MSKLIQIPLLNAVNVLQKGGIIAYPTEAVYGLGCDPFNEQAVMRLLALKKRSWEKGLIVIGADWEQIADLTAPQSQAVLKKAFASWPGPVTWLFPISNKVPKWIHGQHATIALRVPEHSLARAICSEFGTPIVSTSANVEGQSPARDVQTLKQIFGNKIDLYLQGEVDYDASPSEIRDLLTGKVIRER